MIRLHESDLDELRWWADCEFEGEMGRRSTLGGQIDALERGSVSTIQRGSGEVGPRAMRAAGRLRRVERRLAGCTSDQRLLLRAAFRTRDNRGGFAAYGDFPGAALACREVFAAFKEAGGTDLSRLEGWLREIADRALRGKRRDRTAAQRTLERLRGAIEAALLPALLAYGAAIEGCQLPKTASVRELERKLRMDRRTIAAELERRGIPVEPGVGRNGSRVSLRRFPTLWPDAARLLAQSA